MAEIKPISMRLVRLDKAGRPSGPFVEVGAVDLAMRAAQTFEVEAARMQFQTFDLTVQDAAKAFKRLAPLLYDSRRNYLRHRHYWRRGHTHAPKRRYKHGRTGVKRRGKPTRRKA